MRALCLFNTTRGWITKGSFSQSLWLKEDLSFIKSMEQFLWTKEIQHRITINLMLCSFSCKLWWVPVSLMQCLPLPFPIFVHFFNNAFLPLQFPLCGASVVAVMSHTFIHWWQLQEQLRFSALLEESHSTSWAMLPLQLCLEIMG